MKLASLFHRKPASVQTYDHETLEPVIRCSICNGEQVAGFRNKQTGHFEEIALIKSDQDLTAFMDRYGITEMIKRIY